MNLSSHKQTNPSSTLQQPFPRPQFSEEPDIINNFSSPNPAKRPSETSNERSTNKLRGTEVEDNEASKYISQKIYQAIQGEQRYQVKRNQKLITDATTVHVNNVKHQFDPNDIIFSLAKANSKPQHKVKSGFEQNCYCCEHPFKQGTSLKKDI